MLDHAKGEAENEKSDTGQDVTEGLALVARLFGCDTKYITVARQLHVKSMFETQV